MSEDFESPVEKLGEELHEAAVHARENWLKWSALLSALFAVMAALSGLAAAHYANDAMIEQIQASDQWGYYQAKGIKGMMVDTEQDILKQLGKSSADNGQKLQKYRDEQQEIKNKAVELTETSKHHLERHEILSRTVTLCQVAIAMIAIAVLTRRRSFVLVSVGFGILGMFFMVQSFMLF